MRGSPEPGSDAALIRSTRDGDRKAIAALWSRHHRAAVRHAAGLVGSSEAEDVASEAFTNVVGAIERGAGPDELFRPYLYTVIRNVAATEFRRRARHTDAEVDFDAFEDPGPDASTEMARAADRTALGRAFSTLPERWQTVLWYTEVEGLRPRHVAPLVDLQPGAVSSLAFRARQALRAAWIQEHLATEGLPDECRRQLAAFGAYEAGTLSARDRRRLEAHIRDCVHCPPVLDDTRRLAGRIAAALLPPVVGMGIGSAVLHADAPASAVERTATSTPRRPLLSGGTGLVGAVTALVVASTVVAVAGPWSDDRPTATGSETHATGTPTAPVEGTEPPDPAEPLHRAEPRDRAAPPRVDEPSPIPSPGRNARGSSPVIPTAPVSVLDTVLDIASGGSSAAADHDPGTKPTSPRPGTTPDTTGGSSTPGGGDHLPRSEPPVPTQDTMLVASRAVPLTGTATPGSRVEARSGTATAVATAGPDGTWSTTLRFPADGVMRVSITATAPDHTVSVPVVVTVTVDTTAPAPPTIATTLTPTDTTPPTFSGTAEAGSTVAVAVAVTDGTGSASTTTTDADGRWRVAVPGLLPTATGVRVTARDAAGNTSAATDSSPFAFVPSITDPLDGSTATSAPLPITITGWPDADVEVAVDDVVVGTVSTGAAGRFSGHIRRGEGGLAPGRHSITVRYRDGASVSSNATTVAITVVD